jgi:HPr kinase/phosphorylase
VNKLTIEDLLRTKREALQLELLTPDSDLGRTVGSPTVSSPGLVLAGFTSRYPPGRLQVLGETELSFMHSLDEETLGRAVDGFLALDPPALIITKHLEPPPALLRLAAERRIPVLQSTLKTSELYRRLQPYLEEQFAPTTTLHGSLADVYGVGLLLVGRSGIGKSECVLDLVERGHRLVADDVVIITRRGLDVLIGRGHELQSHHMEIRGIGIVDIRTLFGIRAIRQQKRLELERALRAHRPGDRGGGHPRGQAAQGGDPTERGEEHHGDLGSSGHEPPAEVRRHPFREAVQRPPAGGNAPGARLPGGGL